MSSGEITRPGAREATKPVEVLANYSYIETLEVREMGEAAAQTHRFIARAQERAQIAVARNRYTYPSLILAFTVLALAAIGYVIAEKTGWHPWVCLGLFAMCALCVAPMSWKLFGSFSKMVG